MNKKILLIFFITLFSKYAKATQYFNFSFNNISDVYPAYTYNLQTTITVIGIQIGTIYYDGGGSGSFAYSLVLQYNNTLSAVSGTLPTSNGGNFSEYDITATSSTGQTTFHNNFSPAFVTGIGNIVLSGNTYTGSASSFGYVTGSTYSDAATLGRFGFNSMTLAELPPNGGNLQSRSSSLVLPVTLSYFTALPTADKVLLSWSTATEVNSSYFAIERSSTTDFFSTIQNVGAQGNSNRIVNYSFSDNSPLENISYYRLKETDIDGNVMYSNIVSVNRSSSSNGLSFYPSPNKSNTIYFLGNTTQATLDIFSMAGAKLFSKALEGPQLVLPFLPKGMYTFKITLPDHTFKLGKYVQE